MSFHLGTKDHAIGALNQRNITWTWKSCLPLCGELLVYLAIISLRCIFNLVIYLIKLHGFRCVIDLSNLISFSDKLSPKFSLNSLFWSTHYHLKDTSVSALNHFALYILEDVPVLKTSLQHPFFISLYIIATHVQYIKAIIMITAPNKPSSVCSCHQHLLPIKQRYCLVSVFENNFLAKIQYGFPLIKRQIQNYTHLKFKDLGM